MVIFKSAARIIYGVATFKCDAQTLYGIATYGSAARDS